MAEISIAKETSVQEINGKVGSDSDSGASDGTTLFAKIKYAVTSAATLAERITADRMSKIDSIGSTSDSVSATSLMGKLNKAITELTPDAGTETTTTIVSSSTSGSGTLLGTFTAPESRVYIVNATMKASASGAANAAKLVCARGTISEEADGTLILRIASTTAAAGSSMIYLQKGISYKLYLFGTGTPQITALSLTYGAQAEDLIMPSLTASAVSADYIPKDTSSGTGTTETLVAGWKVLQYGSVRVRVTRNSDYASTTRWKLYKNDTLITTNTASTVTVTQDVTVRPGDELELYAYASAAANTWGISAAEQCFSIVWLGDNSLVIRV